jgi:hypothetical protein
MNMDARVTGRLSARLFAGQNPGQRRLALLTLMAVGIGLTVLMTAIVGTSSEQTVRSRPESLSVVIPDLCESVSALREGRRTDAYNLFFRRAHDGLHLIGDELDSRGDSERSRSGELRRTKSVVEAGLLSYPSTLPETMDTLIKQTLAALQVMDPSGSRGLDNGDPC